MIKIGNIYVEGDCIAAVSPNSHDYGKVCIFLTCGKVVYAKATMEEAEIVLAENGMIELPESAFVTEDEMSYLQMLARDGFKYIARDKTGTVYAFLSRPEKNGAYWDPAVEESVERIYDYDFDWVSYDDDEPTDIMEILQQLGEENE